MQGNNLVLPFPLLKNTLMIKKVKLNFGILNICRFYDIFTKINKLTI